MAEIAKKEKKFFIEEYKLLIDKVFVAVNAMYFKILKRRYFFRNVEPSESQIYIQTVSYQI